MGLIKKYMLVSCNRPFAQWPVLLLLLSMILFPGITRPQVRHPRLTTGATYLTLTERGRSRYCFDFNDKTIPQLLRQVTHYYGLLPPVIFPEIDSVTKQLLGSGHAAGDLPPTDFLTVIDDGKYSPIALRLNGHRIYVMNRLLTLSPAKTQRRIIREVVHYYLMTEPVIEPDLDLTSLLIYARQDINLTKYTMRDWVDSWNEDPSLRCYQRDDTIFIHRKY